LKYPVPSNTVKTSQRSLATAEVGFQRTRLMSNRFESNGFAIYQTSAHNPYPISPYPGTTWRFSAILQNSNRAKIT